MIKAVIQETLSSKAGHRLSAGSIRALQPGRACQEGTRAPRDRKEAVLARQVGRAAQPSDHHCHPALQDCGRRGRPQTCRRPPRRLREKRSRSAVGCPPQRGPSATASSPCWSMPLRLPTRTVLQGVRLHNPDYVKYAPSASCECPTSELPGEAAAGEEFAQGGDHPSPPSLTPHFARVVSSAGSGDHCVRSFLRCLGQQVFEGAKCRPEDRQCRAKGITRLQCPWYAGVLPPYAAPLLGRSLSGSQLSRKRASSLPPFPLLGKPSAWLYLAAIPPGLSVLPLPCGPR